MFYHSQLMTPGISIYINTYKYQMNKPPKTLQEKTVAFFRTVEAGDISLFDLIQQAIAVFGFTKVGKTSSCHILANSPLKAQLLNGQIIYKPASQKYNTATIGITNESETQIPNIFQTKFRDSTNTFRTVTILDQPGYGDSYGFHRIFSNGYFHYRTFSKTPKLKFILAFKKTDLQGTAQKFKNTLQYFINTFIDYQLIKDKILAASSFLITQADPKSKLENIKKILEVLKETSVNMMTTKQRDFFKEIVQHMLTNNKVFIIQRPQQPGNNAKQSDILKNIYEKTQFWQRNVEKNVADMSQINFSVADQILNGLNSSKSKGLFKEEFNDFMVYMQNKINKTLNDHKYSLNGIIKILQKDAVGQVEAHSFLDGMKEFNNEFYKFSQAFKEKRQKTQSNLFNLNELNENVQISKGLINNEAINKQRQEKEKEIRQIYFIKKFKVLDFVQTQAMKLNSPDVQRNVQWLEKMSGFFIELFRRFNYLRIVKSDSEKIIYKYSYIIQRLIEQSKIFTLILYSNEENKRKFDNHKENMVEIYRPLQDKLFTAFGEISVPELKKQFVKTLDFNKLKVVNKEIINFFQEINSQNDNKMPLIISKLIITYANTVLQKRRLASEQEKKFISFKLLTYRKMFFAYLKNTKLDGTKKEIEQITQKLFILSNLLGQVLSTLGLFQQSRQVFKSINDAQQVFKIYQSQLKSIVEENKPKLRTLLIDYGKFAGQCHRQELAMKCLQQAYSLSKSYNEFKEVSKQIVNLKRVKIAGDADPYLQRFHQQNYCQQLSKKIEMTLEVYQKQSELGLSI